MADLLDQALTHIDRTQWLEAESCLYEYLKTHPDDARPLFLFGNCAMRGGNLGLAIGLYKAALSLKPRFPEAIFNLGTVYAALHDRSNATQFLELAIELESDPRERAKIMCNLAGTHINEGDAAVGMAIIDAALGLAPDLAPTRFNKGLLHLELGQWREGWRHCEAGFETGDRTFRSYGGLPRWDGTKGQKVIVFGDQGVGDEIMYASMLPDLIRDCREVIFDCHPRLVATWERTFPGITIQGTRKTIHLDWHKGCGAEASVSLSSLGQFYRNETSDFPGTPYVKAAQAQTPHRVGSRGLAVPRIGLAWAGGVPKTRSELRTIGLDLFRPVVESLDADFFSLQYGSHAAGDRARFEELTMFHVKHFPGLVEAEDFDKTIGFVASLDLVIAVCSTAVHAAGAQGVPCWALVPSKPGWRYAGATMPWYGSVELIHQGAGEGWPAVLRRVANRLRQHFHAARAENVA